MVTCTGWGIVTHDKAALWTDSRYFQQADQQMDCNWILMKLGHTMSNIYLIVCFIVLNLNLAVS